MSEELVNIEVDGVPMKARKNAMVIQVTDANGVYIPRFCYHDKLSIAANCRMCLVEVEKAPKPMPACATPVAEGMKVFTKSPKAISAQKATMEFLLINHPLDCPICDQGGECELQDLAMGFGRDVSRYAERKRVFKDENLGPLVSTDMTRCIHCTRCVRFGQEIAGVPALGTIGRGEQTMISTFIEQSIDHELSANIIDLCPVGALNNKPYRYRARAWEMTQVPLVSPHDCVGTNLSAHVLRGRVMRIVPRANEAINESWIADRDRFSYEGFYAADRALKPMVKEGGAWREVDWETALEAAAKGLQQVVREAGPAQVGVLASPIASLEELALTARIARAIGTNNLDHRLRRVDFRDQANDPVAPLLGCSIAEIEQAAGVLVVGSNLRKEVPLIAHRVRQGAIRRGAKVSFINPRAYDVRFPVTADLTSNGLGMAQHLAAVLAASLKAQGKAVPSNVAAALEGVTPSAQHEAVAATLAGGRPARDPARCARAASRRVLGTPRTGDGARHRNRRETRLPARRRQCRRRGTGRRAAAPGDGRTCGRCARTQRRRDAGRAPQGLRARGRHRSGRPRAVVDHRGLVARRRLRRRHHAVRERGNPRQRQRDPAECRVRRNLGHLGQRRRALAERRGRVETRGRGPSGVEDPARARQPARPRRVRLRQLRRSA